MKGPSIDWTAQDWDDLVPRLMLLAVSRLHRMSWRGRAGAAPPGATEAQDLVQDAISKTLSGVRVWRPHNCTLFQHLAGVVVSDIGHLARSAENRSTVAPAVDPPSGRWPPDTADSAPSQEQVMQWRTEQRQLLAHLEAVDSSLGQMAELMLVHDLQETSELSERLGVAASEIANMRKRLKRIVRAYLAAENAP